MQAVVGVVLGTGAEAAVEQLGAVGGAVDTPYGEAALYATERDGAKVLLTPRHGLRHSRLPHKLNYKAHLWALRQAGARFVLATNACGSLRRELPPGSLAVPHDLIDLSRRHTTFWDDEEVQDAAHAHNDFTEPYCRALRAALTEAAQSQGIAIAPRGVYLSVDGPRFETAAEVRLFASWGADLVGMTGGPEAVLAREAGLCYATVAVVGNLAAGLTDGPVTHDDVAAACGQATTQAVGLILHAAEAVHARRCACPTVVPPTPPSR